MCLPASEALSVLLNASEAVYVPGPVSCICNAFLSVFSWINYETRRIHTLPYNSLILLLLFFIAHFFLFVFRVRHLPKNGTKYQISEC